MSLLPVPHANLFSFGLHLTQMAARLILIRTNSGFHCPFSHFQTNAFLSAPHETIWFDCGAQSSPVTFPLCYKCLIIIPRLRLINRLPLKALPSFPT